MSPGFTPESAQRPLWTLTPLGTTAKSRAKKGERGWLAGGGHLWLMRVLGASQATRATLPCLGSLPGPRGSVCPFLAPQERTPYC